jgi:hypothetical protein
MTWISSLDYINKSFDTLEHNQETHNVIKY